MFRGPPGGYKLNVMDNSPEVATLAGVSIDYLVRLEPNPGRLEELESRLAGIEKLKRKYGSTIDEILTFLEQVTRDIEAVENAGEVAVGHRANEGNVFRGPLSVFRVRGWWDTESEGQPRSTHESPRQASCSHGWRPL